MSRILVVDDESVARDSLARLLTSAGHAAVTAANGRDAWLTMYEAVPDLILLDLMMPQMDGITFLSLLRHSDHWADVPVIVVTGFSDDDGLVGQARELGVAEVVPKSGCEVDQLISLVQQTLTQSPERQTCAPPQTRTHRGMTCNTVRHPTAAWERVAPAPRTACVATRGDTGARRVVSK